MKPGVSMGIDLVDVREVADSIARFGARYMRRVFTEGEIAYALRAPSDTARRLAARFAAKEAALKALRARDRGVAWTSIEVVVREGGWPDLVLSSGALEAARAAGIAGLSVSMTHEGEWAAAVVMAEHVRTPKSRLSFRRVRRSRR